jgi:adenosylmethionine-8-amino-7-oxononanoate aminotransferase
VEIVVKMVYQYFRNIGTEKKNLFRCLKGGYHGESFGAMIVAGRSSQYHSTFCESFFNIYIINVPEYDKGVENIEEQEAKILEELEQQLSAMRDRSVLSSLNPSCKVSLG